MSSDVRLKLVKVQVFIANGIRCNLHADQMGHRVHLRNAFLFPGTDFRPGCAWLWADHWPASNSLV